MPPSQLPPETQTESHSPSHLRLPSCLRLEASAAPQAGARRRRANVLGCAYRCRLWYRPRVLLSELRGPSAANNVQEALAVVLCVPAPRPAAPTATPTSVGASKGAAGLLTAPTRAPDIASVTASVTQECRVGSAMLVPVLPARKGAARNALLAPLTTGRDKRVIGVQVACCVCAQIFCCWFVQSCETPLVLGARRQHTEDSAGHAMTICFGF